MIQEMEKMSLINEKLLIAQMSLLMDDDCNTQMAIEYCLAKRKNLEKHSIKAKKVGFFGKTKNRQLEFRKLPRLFLECSNKKFHAIFHGIV
jgi:hypothetical protein